MKTTFIQLWCTISSHTFCLSFKKFIVEVLYKSCQTRASLVKIDSVTVTWGCKWIAVHIPYISWLIRLKFNVGIGHVMPLNSYEFSGNWSESYTLLKGKRYFVRIMCIFLLFVYNKVWEMFTKVYCVIVSFIKIGMMKAIL